MRQAKQTKQKLQHMFNQAVMVTKQRIRLMELIKEPKAKTLKAITVRKALLARYERAYKEQLEMLAAGIVAPHIRDMI